MTFRTVLRAALVVAMASSMAWAQDPAKLLTKADVEKAAGVTFKDGWAPMKGQVQFEQAGGDLQISLDIETREAGATVRGWEATMKKMQPAIKVETVPGLGSDAIFYSTRADLGKVSADFDQPRVQISVSVAGATSAAQARQIVLDLAKVAAARIRK